VFTRNQYWLSQIQQETNIGCIKFNKKLVLVVSNSTRNQYWLSQIQQETNIGCLKFNKKPVLVVSNSTRNQYWLSQMFLVEFETTNTGFRLKQEQPILVSG
jgi:hypothetical protein